MSSSDRLAELRRQRALVAEHLAWLDREIAAAEGPAEATARPSETKAPVRAPGTPVIAAAAGTVAAGEEEADLILEHHRVGKGDIQRDVRRGCFLYFAAALLAVAIGVAVLYLALKR